MRFYFFWEKIFQIKKSWLFARIMLKDNYLTIMNDPPHLTRSQIKLLGHPLKRDAVYQSPAEDHLPLIGILRRLFFWQDVRIA